MFAIWRRAVAPVVRGAHNFLDWRGLAGPIEVRGWPIEVRGLANRSEGLGAGLAQGPVDKSEGFLSIKVRGWGAGLAQGRAIVPWWIWSQGQVP